ncbi:hypothetical protein BDV32DRAFT_16592 [Aspergillus pseudonomiae]|nr:hypothetical protein BDV32DRAFT_16592 [Aspergillus pseudonomiae]
MVILQCLPCMDASCSVSLGLLFSCGWELTAQYPGSAIGWTRSSLQRRVPAHVPPVPSSVPTIVQVVTLHQVGNAPSRELSKGRRLSDCDSGIRPESAQDPEHVTRPRRSGSGRICRCILDADKLRRKEAERI